MSETNVSPKPVLKMTAYDFSKAVEILARRSGEYLSAVLEVCDKHDVDYESVSMYLKPPLMEKLTAEACSNKLLKNIQHTHTGSLFG